METQIPIPRKDDPMEWAMLPETEALWVASVAEEYDIDIEKFLLGQVLTHIVNDDANCFGALRGIYNAKQASIDKEHLIIRMRWEIAQPQTPAEVRRRLEIFLPYAQSTNWSTESGFEEVREAWRTEIQEATIGEIGLHPDYDEAILYREDRMSILRKSFADFLDSQTR